MKNVRNWSISLLTFLAVFLLGLSACQKETGIATSLKNDGIIEQRDQIPKHNVTFQFQYSNVNYSRAVVTENPCTKAEGIAALTEVYNRMTKTEKAAFKCAYDKQVNFIGKSVLYQPKNYPQYVSACCANCIKDLKKDGGARCDIQLNRGTAFNN